MLDLTGVAGWRLDRLNVKGRSGLYDWLPEQMRERRGIRIEDESHTLHCGRDMFERLQPLAAYGEFETGEAGEVAPRAGKVLHEAVANRINHLHEHDRWGIALAQSRRYRRAGRKDYVRAETDQFTCLAE